MSTKQPLSRLAVAGTFAAICLAVVVAVAVAVWPDAETPPPTTPATIAATSTDPTPTATPDDPGPLLADEVEFRGVRWKLTREVETQEGWGSGAKLIMFESPRVPGARLLTISPLDESVTAIKRIYVTQVQLAGQWVDDGFKLTLERNGTKFEQRMSLGKQTGEDRFWYANGNLRAEYVPANDRIYCREWWENGQVKYEGFSIDGRHTAVGRWNEQGVKLPITP